MVATAEHPRLRPDLVVRCIPGDDELSYVVKDPQTRKYYRFPEAAGELMQLFDGRTSLPEVQQRLRSSGKPVPSVGAIEALVQQLRAKDLLELSAAERLEHQMESGRTERRLRVRWRNAHGSLLHYRFSFWDPDRWMDRVVPRLRFFWTPWFFVLSLLVILTATGIVAANAELFGGQFLRLVMGAAPWQEYVSS
jgi:putative peptide zinc metalloprotease protein